uniref:Large ribosomal subunit protein uL4c n=1 Tax=Caulacanthus okamurae TaxID=152008 RepID=A0A6H1U9D3_9FLOR|nr:50S ribosomal protein L4 [Caulacanthus okamurae]QIZ74663.1 50S ribosomal protein L4 [Caulacanthus okamurae]
MNEKKLKPNIQIETNKQIKTDNNNIYIIHRALIQQLHNKRQGTVNTKTRSEVRGGGRKPWKQKGTGRARAGSIRSPLWKGGGVIFGPQNKNYQIKVNRKEKKIALNSLIHNKLGCTTLVESFPDYTEKPSTKKALNYIESIGIKTNITKTLLIVDSKNKNLHLSTRNLKNFELIKADQINIVALLKADQIIITSKALNIINEVYNGKN